MQPIPRQEVSDGRDKPSSSSHHDPACSRALAPVPARIPRRPETAFRNSGLGFFGDLATLADPNAFAARIAALRSSEWVVYAKPPFDGPTQVLAYFARYTYRAAIAKSRLVAINEGDIAFTYKDYRRSGQPKVMRLDPHEFIRHFLLHALPDGFHRIRYYGFMAKANRVEKLKRCRALLAAQSTCDDRPPTSTEQTHRPQPHPVPRLWRRDASAARGCRQSSQRHSGATRHDHQFAAVHPHAATPSTVVFSLLRAARVFATSRSILRPNAKRLPSPPSPSDQAQHAQRPQNCPCSCRADPLANPHLPLSP
nr:transposase [Rhodoblastus sphagnicola]